MKSLARRSACGRRDRVRYALIAAACAAMCISAHAGDFSVGVGAGVDQGRADCVAVYPCDRSSTHAKLFVGYRLAESIELQALVFDAGHFEGGDTTELGTAFGGRFKVSGVGIAAGYRWAFAPAWSLKGQLGIASVRTRFDYATPFAGAASQTTTQPIAGLSLGYEIAPNWRLSADVDQTRFKVHTTRGSLRMVGVAAQFAF